MHSGGNIRRSGSRGMKQVGPELRMIRSGPVQGSKKRAAARRSHSDRESTRTLAARLRHGRTSLTGQRTTDQVEFPTWPARVDALGLVPSSAAAQNSPKGGSVLMALPGTAERVAEGRGEGPGIRLSNKWKWQSRPGQPAPRRAAFPSSGISGEGFPRDLSLCQAGRAGPFHCRGRIGGVS